MAETQEYQAGFGGPDQLPFGAVSDVNASLPNLGRAGGNIPGALSEAEVADRQAVAPAEPSDYEPAYTPETDDDAFITGPTTRPDESQSVGAELTDRLPGHVRTQLPALQRAAAEPGASAQLQALVAYLLRTA
jgi:hypothetical protein